ncbi:hypothetical protein IFM89_037252 [Coptis chinensis]|uniref:Uncharacterized protein n=1 Tax=Coptis chinensis TaxID=261450 RepID=A0A835I7F3_9MAGN|nr:hypothetical protein IFM89_037252 [Coptis chinensis]
METNQQMWYWNSLIKGFHFVVLLTGGSGIRDTQCGFKMCTWAAARKLFTNICLKRNLNADIDVLKAAMRGIHIQQCKGEDGGATSDWYSTNSQWSSW